MKKILIIAIILIFVAAVAAFSVFRRGALRFLHVDGEISIEQEAMKYYLEGDYNKASQLYEKILVMQPESLSAILSLAIIYDDYLKEKEKAISLYKKYMEIRPKSDKKELVRQWMVQAAQESLGMEELGKEKNKNKIEEMQKEISELKKNKALLDKEVEKLSGKLYAIESDHQKEILELQRQRDKAFAQITECRIKISDLKKEIGRASKTNESMKKELVELKEFKLRYGKERVEKF